MKNEARTPEDENTQGVPLDKASTPILPTSNSKIAQQGIHFPNRIARLPILQVLIAVAGILCLVFILGKLVNQYDLTSVCFSWNCVTIQNPDTCSTKHLLSLGIGGAFGVLSGIGIALFIPAGAIIAPAIAGLLVGAGVFGGSAFLLDLFIQC
jgi:hypothetical protein